MNGQTAALVLDDPPQWLRDLCGAAWSARETFRLMGTPHMLLETALADLPEELQAAVRLP